MASLLSLRPSKSVEEKQEMTRNKILNSPALPSSSGLLTSFGGLKKEESLSKSLVLTRNSLGIAIKKPRMDKIDNNIQENKSVESNKKAERVQDDIKTQEDELKGSTKINIDSKKDICKGSLDSKTTDLDCKELKANNDVNVKDDNKNIINEEKKVKVSLVGDYSSSDTD